MEIQTKDIQDIRIVRLDGKILGETATDPLLEYFNASLAEGVKKFAVDLQGLSHINSLGLGLMVTLNTRILNQGGRIIFYHSNSLTTKLFKVTRLDQVLEVCDQESNAIDILNAT